MSSKESLNVDQNTLVNAWQEQLPEFLNPGDSAIVQADNADPNGLRVQINAAGHQFYSLDFQCTYMDPREVKVQLVDAQRDGVHIDERTEQVQELTSDYVRHLHECAQSLHRITNQ